MELTDKELNVIVREFQALSEFLNEPENDRNDKRQIRSILKKARAEKEKRANKACTGRRAPSARKNRSTGEAWLARMEAYTNARRQ